MTSYRVYGFEPYIFVAVLVLLTIFAPFVLVGATPGLFAVVWVAILAWFWLNALVRVAYEIRLNDDGTVAFKALLRETTVRATDIQLVRSDRMGGKIVVFHHTRGKSLVLQPIDQLHDLLHRLETSNPRIEVRGL